MTPRKSARVHLPELAESFPALTETFGQVTLEHLKTPDGEWGADSTADWLTLAALPWPRPWKRPKQGRDKG